MFHSDKVSQIANLNLNESKKVSSKVHMYTNNANLEFIDFSAVTNFFIK